jgi:hypothetical protein
MPLEAAGGAKLGVHVLSGRVISARADVAPHLPLEEVATARTVSSVENAEAIPLVTH